MVTLVRSLILFRRAPPLWPHCNINYLSKIPHPNIITMKGKVSTHEFGMRHKHFAVMRLPAMQETHVHSLGWKIWRRTWQPTSGSLPGEFHGQRSLAGYSLWGHKSQTQLSTKPPPQTFSSFQAQPLFCSIILLFSESHTNGTIQCTAFCQFWLCIMVLRFICCWRYQ